MITVSFTVPLFDAWFSLNPFNAIGKPLCLSCTRQYKYSPVWDIYWSAFRDISDNIKIITILKKIGTKNGMEEGRNNSSKSKPLILAGFKCLPLSMKVLLPDELHMGNIFIKESNPQRTIKIDVPIAKELLSSCS